MGNERILFFSVGFGVGVEYVKGGKERYFFLFSDSESMSDSKVFRNRSRTRELESKVFRSWSLSRFLFSFSESESYKLEGRSRSEESESIRFNSWSRSQD